MTESCIETFTRLINEEIIKDIQNKKKKGKKK